MAFRGGFQQLWQHKKMWLWIWLIHVAGAASLAWGFSNLWDDVLSGRLVVSEFGGDGTMAILVDAFAHHREVIPYAIGFLGIAIAYVWLGAVLAGGILGRLGAGERGAGERGAGERGAGERGAGKRGGGEGVSEAAPFLAGFFGDCGLYLGRFTRLLLVQMAVLLAFGFGMAFALGAVLGALFSPSGSDGAISVIAILLAALASFIYIILAMVFDYAKVRIVREGRRSAFMAWFAGAQWAVPRLHRTLGLQLIFVALFTLVTFLYWTLAPQAAASGTFWLALGVQQAYLLFRAGLRVHWYGAELALYDALS